MKSKVMGNTCHTERSEVSQIQKRDFSPTAQNDKMYCHTERKRSIHKRIALSNSIYGFFAALRMTMGRDFLRIFAINLTHNKKDTR